MLIDQSTMDKLHDIQFEMLKELIRVMDLLQVKYYFVHGSLLGAVRDNDFIAEDDDIDIAVFREDYNRLMYHGQALLSQDYFLQNSANDRYPLAFAKMRKNNTAFIQPVLDRLNCNKGVYIDIFPIDYEDTRWSFRLKTYLLNTRISQIFPEKRNLKARLLGVVSKLLCFSYDKALLKREILFSSSTQSDYLTIYGGKPSEKHIPAIWFNHQVYFQFRDICVACPSGYIHYLKRIYGNDYLKHNPADTRIDGMKIEISANILDFEKSYLDYQ